MAKKATKRAPLPDGFYWQEWRDGRLWQEGHHNGTTLDGKDASMDHKALCVAVSASDLEAALKGRA